MPTANQRLLDELLAHELGLRRVHNRTRREVLAYINEIVPDLEALLRKRFGFISARGFDSSKYTLKRLEANLREVRKLLDEAIQRAHAQIRDDSVSAAKYEAEWTAGKIAKEVVIRLDVQTVAPSLMRALVTSRPFQGALLRDHMSKLSRDSYDKVQKAIREGLFRGEGIDKIVRRVRGTKAMGFADGAMQATRREAQKIVYTAAQHVTSEARAAVYQANADILEGIRWTATLDLHTCEICGPRDGKLWTLDHEPIDHDLEWLDGPGKAHWNCRCVGSPVLKAWGKQRGGKNATPTQRASMDGAVPGKLTFEDWIARQPAARQDQWFGRTRGQAYRKGKIGWNDLFDDRGSWQTLDKLKGLEANG